MRPFRYSAYADAQLVEIAQFSVERFGEAQTKRYLAEMEDRIARAVTGPARLKHRPELGKGLYSVRCRSHVAYLSQDADGAWIVIAVLHGRMDPARRLPPQD